jgi:hypothetical protein
MRKLAVGVVDAQLEPSVEMDFDTDRSGVVAPAMFPAFLKFTVWFPADTDSELGPVIETLESEAWRLPVGFEPALQ